jgi:hypothetical protein
MLGVVKRNRDGLQEINLRSWRGREHQKNKKKEGQLLEVMPINRERQNHVVRLLRPVCYWAPSTLL